MEQTIIEQTENEARAAGADRVEGEGTREFSFKKFKNIESLQKAYSSLESEFTKRSQRLKMLEGERDMLLKRVEQIDNSNSASQARGQGSDGGVEEFLKKRPRAADYLKTLTEMVVESGDESAEFLTNAYTDLLQGEIDRLREKGSDEDYLYSQIEGTAIKDRIVKEYLSGVKNARPKAKLMGGDGAAAIAPPIKPSTLAEATVMAGELIKKYT